MTPAQVAALLDEPDWVAQWELLRAADDGLDALLGQWRRWHWSPVIINGEEKKLPAPATDGIIALARLGIMPSRSLTERRPGLFEEQADAHMWLSISGRAWRIMGLEDHMLFLNSFGEEKQIDLSKLKWEKYIEAASTALGAYHAKT